MFNNRKNQFSIKEIYPTIYCITLPLPVQKPEWVNCYLVLGKKITLIDVGTSRTVGLLGRALASIGIAFADIDQIIITHAHVDHYGAARDIVQKSGGRARVAASDLAIDGIEQGLTVPSSVISRFLILMGLPPLLSYPMRWAFLSHRFLCRKCRVDIALVDGHALEVGDHAATVIATPGHTVDSICIYLNAERVVFSGDHILSDIAPYAFLMFDADAPEPLRESQAEYYASLARIEELDPLMVYPAHGDAITDFRRLAKVYKRQFSMKQRKILSLIPHTGSCAYQITRRLFPGCRLKRLMLVDLYHYMSEVYGHIQMLKRTGLVESAYKNGKILFRRVENRG